MTKAQKSSSGKSPAQDATSPWPKRLMIVGGFVAFVLLVAFILDGTLNEPIGGVPDGTEEVAVGAPQHVDGVIYAEDEVPAGGEHSAIWANCGFYSEPVAAENAVHSLEHGAVWITYRPDLPSDQLDILRKLARPIEKVLASPVQDQDSPIMATAWGTQLELSSADDPRLDQFVVEFAGSHNAPEPGGACTRGVGSPDG
ncbi:MAG: DUF3105 domain-containing protein [Acidimicrobiia bacterium]